MTGPDGADDRGGGGSGVYGNDGGGGGGGAGAGGGGGRIGRIAAACFSFSAVSASAIMCISDRFMLRNSAFVESATNKVSTCVSCPRYFARRSSSAICLTMD